MIQDALLSHSTRRPILPARAQLLLAATQVVAVRMGLGVLFLYLVLQTFDQWNSIVRLKLLQSSDPSVGQQFDDYAAFYAAGRLTLEGHGSDIYDLPTVARAEEEALGRPAGGTLDDGVLPYFNPPFFAGLLALLALLPLGTFGLALFVIVCGLIVACGAVMSRLLRLRWWERALFWSWYLSLGSITFIGLQSQTSVWPLLGWSCFLALQMAGKSSLSGLSLGLALVKPQLILVLVLALAAKRQVKAILPFSIVAALLVIISIAIAGPLVLHSYPALLLESSSWDHENGIIQANMYGWSGFFARTLGGTGTLDTLATWPAVIATLFAVVWACRGKDLEQRPNCLLVAGVMICASLLMSVHLYRQDLSMLALAVVCGASYSWQTQKRWGVWPALAAFLWLSQAFGPRLLFEHGINVQTPMVCVILLALALTLAIERRRELVQVMDEKQDSLRIAPQPAV